MKTSARQEFLAGVRAEMPILVGVVPFGLISLMGRRPNQVIRGLRRLYQLDPRICVVKTTVQNRGIRAL